MKKKVMLLLLLQLILGAVKMNGQNVYSVGSSDSTLTVDQLRRVAEQGDAEAQYNLGVCYYEGEGMPRSDEKAVMWWREAAAQGNEEAREMLEKHKDINIYDVHEEGAEFVGDGYAWLAKNICYPSICAENNVQGKVVVSFVVDTDGSISDVEVMRSPHEELSKEAVRVVKSMPKWKPARQAGKPVRERRAIPIVFRL